MFVQDIADIVISEKIGIERKGGLDFPASITDNRLAEQLPRLKEAYETPILMLEGFNEGRSRSFYCVAAALLSVDDVKNSLESAKKEVKTLGLRKDDIKSKAKILKKAIQDVADRKGIDLKFREPTK